MARNSFYNSPDDEEDELSQLQAAISNAPQYPEQPDAEHDRLPAQNPYYDEPVSMRVTPEEIEERTASQAPVDMRVTPQEIAARTGSRPEPISNPQMRTEDFGDDITAPKPALRTPEMQQDEFPSADTAERDMLKNVVLDADPNPPMRTDVHDVAPSRPDRPIELDPSMETHHEDYGVRKPESSGHDWGNELQLLAAVALDAVGNKSRGAGQIVGAYANNQDANRRDRMAADRYKARTHSAGLSPVQEELARERLRLQASGQQQHKQGLDQTQERYATTRADKSDPNSDYRQAEIATAGGKTAAQLAARHANAETSNQDAADRTRGTTRARLEEQHDYAPTSRADAAAKSEATARAGGEVRNELREIQPRTPHEAEQERVAQQSQGRASQAQSDQEANNFRAKADAPLRMIDAITRIQARADKALQEGRKVPGIAEPSIDVPLLGNTRNLQRSFDPTRDSTNDVDLDITQADLTQWLTGAAATRAQEAQYAYMGALRQGNQEAALTALSDLKRIVSDEVTRQAAGREDAVRPILEVSGQQGLIKPRAAPATPGKQVPRRAQPSAAPTEKQVLGAAIGAEDDSDLDNEPFTPREVIFVMPDGSTKKPYVRTAKGYNNFMKHFPGAREAD